MLDTVLAPEELSFEVKHDALSCYQFGSDVAKHYFCKVCGIYPFHETRRKAGHYPVNLGCVEGLDSFSLQRTVFNGRVLI